MKVEILEQNRDELADETERLNTFFTYFKTKVGESHSRMRQIDRIGAFESDDETGVVFRELKEIIDRLNEEF